jgi:hypothetical protein
MGGIGRNKKDRAPDLCKLNGERARGSGLSNTTLSTNKDPAEAALVKEGLEGGLEGVLGGDDGGGHFGRSGDEVVGGRRLRNKRR